MKLEKGILLDGCRFVLVEPVKDMNRLDEIIKTKKSVFVRHRMYPTAFIQNWQFRLVSSWLKAGWIWETNDLIGDSFEIID